jgi:large subunit ribosomal protein L25
MKKHILTVTKRKTLGKKVGKLRKEGILPGNIYGRDFKSLSVQVAYKDFEPVFKEAGETGLVEIHVDEQVIPVLIHNVQTDYKRTPLHADFYKVNLKEKVKTMVPLEFIGEPKAVTDKVGLLMEIISEVEVEALPTELPEKVEVNVESLAAIDEQITVADLKLPNGVEILTDPGQVVAKIGELISKAAQAQAEEEAAAAAAASTEGAEGEGAIEGEAPAEGAEPKTEGTTETKPEEKPAA